MQSKSLFQEMILIIYAWQRDNWLVLIHTIVDIGVPLSKAIFQYVEGVHSTSVPLCITRICQYANASNDGERPYHILPPE